MSALETLTTEFGALAVAGAFAVIIFASFTKGAVGFGLPMIVISGVGSLMSAEVAIAALILPSLATNIWQSLRNGIGAAVSSLYKFWRLNIIMLAMIYLCAQLVVIIPEDMLFVILGTIIITFASLQIMGFVPRIAPRLKNWVEAGVGLLSGFFGGLSGVWGGPILIYLVAMDTPKAEQVRVQGISFLIGSVVLVVAHRQSGLLNEVNTWFSAILIIPAFIGIAAGFRLQDKLDQALFRKATLIVLVLAGLNLLRRGIFG